VVEAEPRVGIVPLARADQPLAHERIQVLGDLSTNRLGNQRLDGRPRETDADHGCRLDYRPLLGV
jgi:hypothetical protein